MSDDIPPLRAPQDMPPVHTQADLYGHWRALMGELGFSEPLLWFQFFDSDGQCTPIVQQVGDPPEIADTDLLTNLMWICQQVLDDFTPGGSVAFLLSRPGTPILTASDRAWATSLATAARKAGVACHPVHLANDYELRPFTPDDSIAC